MASLIIIAAEELIPLEHQLLPIGSGASQFQSAEEAEEYTLKAIDRARELVAGHTGIYNAVVTTMGSLMAMVRWNIQLDADPPVEVARFKDGLCPY